MRFGAWPKSTERTFVCMATMFTKIYGKQQWEKCLFVPGSHVTLMTGMQWLLCRKFCGLNFRGSRAPMKTFYLQKFLRIWYILNNNLNLKPRLKTTFFPLLSVPGYEDITTSATFALPEEDC